MKTNQSGILNINFRVFREDKSETNRLQIYGTLWTNLSNVEIKEFEKEDLKNITISKEHGINFGLLKLKIVIISTGEPKLLNKFIPLNCCLDLTNGENADFKFDEYNDNILLINVNNQVTGNPTGTKRTVITYEDTDVIDETKH